MDKYYQIKKDKLSSYPNIGKAFNEFPYRLSDLNVGAEFYYHWRLKERSQDESIVTKIALIDLEEVKV
jgi:hypothetical protein